MTTSILGRTRRPAFTLDGALWAAQTIVAFVFFFVGSDRALTPIRDVEHRVGWVRDIAAQLPLRTVGTIELILALGLIVPAATRFWPLLTPVCASLLAILAVAGATAHVMEHEWLRVFSSLLLAALSVFIAYGRAFLVRIPKMYLDEEDRADWPSEAHRPTP